MLHILQMLFENIFFFKIKFIYTKIKKIINESEKL